MKRHKKEGWYQTRRNRELPPMKHFRGIGEESVIFQMKTQQVIVKYYMSAKKMLPELVRIKAWALTVLTS